jgi:hypothetical protein
VVAFWLPDCQLKDVTVSLANAELTVATALLGVVLAGMAVLVVFLSQEYMRVLAQLTEPIVRFERILFPFWFVAGLTVGTIFWDLGILTTAGLATDVWRRVLLAGSTWFVMWTLFEVMAVVALVSGHGANRARQVLREQRPREQQATNPDE